MVYAFEMGSGAMTYIPSLIKILSNIQKFMAGWDRHTDSMGIADSQEAFPPIFSVHF
jgi:hypothetical protein